MKRIEKEVSTSSVPLKASFAGTDACEAFINGVSYGAGMFAGVTEVLCFLLAPFMGQKY